MVKKNFVFSLLLAATALLSSVFAQNPDDEILLTVGNEKVTKGEFLRNYQKNNNLTQSSEKDLRDYLDLFVVYKLKVQDGLVKKVDTAMSFQRELAGYRGQSAQQYLIDKEVTENLVDEAFERSKSQVRASHLLINCDYNASPKDTLAAYNKIMRIRKEIIDGLNFNDAAVKYSEDPSAKDRPDPQSKRVQRGNRGELGYFSVFSLIYPFETGAYTTPVGTVSMPVRSQFGYHLIYVQDKVPTIDRIVVSQIFVEDTNALSGHISPAIQAKLDKIQQALKTTTFEEVVTQYSEDKASMLKEGKLMPFRPDQRSGSFVAAAIHEKVGELSKPVASVLGWHLIRLDTLDYAKMNDEMKYLIRTRIARDSRSYKSKSSLVDRLKKEYKFEDKGRAAAFKYFEKNLPVSYFQSTNIKMEDLKDMDKLKPICSFADQKLTVPEFATYISRFQGMPVTNLSDFLKEKYESFVGEKILAYENDHLEQKYAAFKDLIVEFHDGLMLYEMNANQVWNKAMQDSVGLEQFYEKNRQKYEGELSEIRAVVVNDYQDFLEKEWVEQLKATYPVVIDEKSFRAIIKR
ncbi:MAG: peptidylprolyl isomerase [Bacteroidales bacterium]|jgi:peptidyl-prolyl cis-trans isomerase SurA|nr:peptidylprolyl isomerase [Bacteroidales bacterium]